MTTVRSPLRGARVKRKFRYRRTSEVKMTNEARLLKKLRQESGASIKDVAQAVGKSETYIRHVENGRLDLPCKEVLLKIISLYSCTWRVWVQKSRFKVEESLIDEVKNRLPQLSEKQLKIVLSLIRSL